MALYDNIIVPLDGSELSSHALAPACLMAGISGADLTLARAFDPIPVWHADAEHGRFSSAMALAEHDRITAFLAAERGRLERMGVTAPVHVAAWEGPADEFIVDLGNRHPGALIVMSTHGRGGLSRLVMGSVTSRVVRSVSNPTLVVRGWGKGGTAVGKSLDNIIVPLDGSAFAERSLPHAGELARACGAQLILMRSTHDSDYFRSHTQWTRLDGEGGFHFGGPAEMATSMAALSREYLWRKAAEMEAQFGLTDVEAVNSRENPVDAVVELAERSRNGLVVMATRGRRGVERALLGSVADQVVRHSPAPTLLVRGPMPVRDEAGERREKEMASV